MTTELNELIPNTKKELKMRMDLNESMVKMSERLEEIEEENKRVKKRQGKRSTGLQLRVAKNYYGNVVKILKILLCTVLNTKFTYAPKTEVYNRFKL